jgi:4-(2-carboxyphenyl)-2-oxobut-3-enoate aldolase
MTETKATLMRAGELRGVIGYLLTPVKDESIDYTTKNAIDIEETARATDALIRDGVSALCLNGTFGEVASLCWEELKLFTATVIQAARGRVPVFAGATTLNTRDTIARAREFHALGARGLMLGRPMMSPLSDENIVRFYRDVAQGCPELNIILYDDPEAFRRPISTVVYRQLAKIPQIIAAKYRTRLNISGLTDNSYNADIEAVGGHIKLLPGEFDWFIASRLYGLDTCWSSLVCGGPAPVMALRDALGAARWSEAEALTREISHCYEGLIPHHNFEAWHLDKIPFMKARFAAAGYLKPGPALPPYQYLSPERRKIAEECGRRSRVLQEKYRDRAAAA